MTRVRTFRPLLCLGLAALAAVAARTARAELPPAATTTSSGGDVINPASFRTPQTFAFELRVGPYKPNVDSEFTGPDESRPHQLYFGDGTRVMVQAGVEWQFLHRGGTWALGLGLGYFRESANAFVESNGALTDERSSDVTRLSLVPATVSAVYRMDLLARLGVPLVPYGKVGLDTAWWRITNGNGDVATLGNAKGQGLSYGWHAAAGLALLLDVFDPGAAQEFDATTGVNHTYLFAEYAHHDLSGFGRSGVLQVGDTTWSAGLLLEF